MKKKIYYGDQTKAALNNFPFPTPHVSLELIYAIVLIKKAAAFANKKTGELSPAIAESIVTACNEILAGEFDNQFVTPALQGGAGTSINMNVNEVIATRATELCGEVVHPNDHVNAAQSTNDVNPSALKITCLTLTKILLENITLLIQAFEDKAKQCKSIPKLARTHLQDAIPTTFGAEFQSYADILRRDKQRIEESLSYFEEINLGGTAIGDSTNASDEYIKYVYQELREITRFPLKKANNLMSQTSSSSDFCHLSAMITILFTDISKTATDIRFLASGPRGGIGEITLKELQKGSSIMPGKINPVSPEAMNQIAFAITGKHMTILQAAQNACLELAVMFPVLADELIETLKLAASGALSFANCIETMQPNIERAKENLENSTAYATVLVPKLGYDLVSEVVKESIASKKPIREILIKKNLLTDESILK